MTATRARTSCFQAQLSDLHARTSCFRAQLSDRDLEVPEAASSVVTAVVAVAPFSSAS